MLNEHLTLFEKASYLATSLYAKDEKKKMVFMAYKKSVLGRSQLTFRRHEVRK
jgi:hypothetical protein